MIETDDETTPDAEPSAAPKRQLFFARLAAAVRRQDWFVVALEVAIVVLGVFLGVQLGNWNAARVESARAHAALASLSAEISALQVTADSALSYHSRNIDNLQALALALDRGAMAPGDSVPIRDALAKGGSFSPAPGAPATLTQLVSSGQLHLIRSDSLRSALLDFKDLVESAPDVFLHIRLEQTALDAFRRHIVYTDGIGERTRGYTLGLVESFDFDAMRGDSGYLASVRAQRQMQIYYWGNHSRIRQRLAGIDRLIQAARR